MSNWLDLEVQRIRIWAQAISTAVAEGDPRFQDLPPEDPYILAGILLRESGAGFASGYTPRGSLNGYGDGGHAVTPWQFDLRDRDNNTWFATSPDAKTMLGQARRAVMYLREGRMMLRWGVPEVALTQAAICAYNADPRKVLRATVRGDPDFPTTGRDYGKWVLSKARALRVVAPDLFAVSVA
jgi:hypothetical protein